MLPHEFLSRSDRKRQPHIYDEDYSLCESCCDVCAPCIMVIGLIILIIIISMMIPWIQHLSKS